MRRKAAKFKAIGRDIGGMGYGMGSGWGKAVRVVGEMYVHYGGGGGHRMEKGVGKERWGRVT